MGCLASKLKFTPNDKEGQSISVIHLTCELGYTTADVNQMYQYFRKRDHLDNGKPSITKYFTNSTYFHFSYHFIYSGTMQVDEFVLSYKISPLLASQMFDYNDSGCLNFKEFLLATWNYLTLDDKHLPLFMFKLFEKDNSGYLSNQDFMSLINMVCGVDTKISQATLRLVNENDINRDGRISLLEFINIAQRSKLMMPVFTMRNLFRKYLIGKRRWYAMTKYRYEIFGDKLLPDVLYTIENKPQSDRDGARNLDNKEKRVQSKSDQQQYSITMKEQHSTTTIYNKERDVINLRNKSSKYNGNRSSKNNGNSSSKLNLPTTETYDFKTIEVGNSMKATNSDITLLAESQTWIYSNRGNRDILKPIPVGGGGVIIASDGSEKKRRNVKKSTNSDNKRCCRQWMLSTAVLHSYYWL